MTLPDEEARAINATREFLFDLMNLKATPRVPREVRERAQQLARHYPIQCRVDKLYWAMARLDDAKEGR